ncbi:Uncharacterised protein [Serratia fonticola]|uniref:Uncharacterized protein n=1 Tax=Serratia fonticola TaxID=47917 RepID=A0A4V6KT73_SERFO|nr:Uncharacterised protein [Serratia fonticola]
MNKKVSDMSYSLLSLGKKTDSNENSGLPTLSKNSPIVDKQTIRELAVPVDVDTAAARVKRYYNFTSSDAVNTLKGQGLEGSMKAAAITQGGYAGMRNLVLTIRWAGIGAQMRGLRTIS